MIPTYAISVHDLVVDEHERTTSESTHCDNLFTHAVIFFATPHAGSQLASMGEMLARIGSVFIITNTALLGALNSDNDNGQLEELRTEFDKMLGPTENEGITVVNFRETKPMSNVAFGPTAREVSHYRGM